MSIFQWEHFIEKCQSELTVFSSKSLLWTFTECKVKFRGEPVWALRISVPWAGNARTCSLSHQVLCKKVFTPSSQRKRQEGVWGCREDLGALQSSAAEGLWNSRSWRRVCGRRKKIAENILVERGGCRGRKFRDKLGVVSLFAEQLTHAGPVSSHWQLDDTSGALIHCGFSSQW